MTDFVIRRAEPRDAKDILETHYDAVHITGSKSYRQDILDHWDIGITPERVRVMERKLKASKAINLVAEVNGKVVGFTAIIPKNNELQAIYVHSSYSGRGIGQKLLERVESEARRLELPYLWLHSTINAKDFYLKNGYENLRPAWDKWGPTKMSCYVMRKVLSEKFVNPVPTLETDRLLLRPIRLSDAPFIFEYAKILSVSSRNPWEPPQKLGDTEEFIHKYIFSYYDRGVPEPLGIAWKHAPDLLIGTVGCFWISKPWKTMELTYSLSESHRGKGVIIEAASSLLAFAFHHMDVNKVVARCKTECAASDQLLRKLGFALEGTQLQAVFHSDRFWDIHCYGLLKSKFAEKANLKLAATKERAVGSLQGQGDLSPWPWMKDLQNR